MTREKIGTGALLLALTTLGGCGGPLLKTGGAYDHVKREVAADVAAPRSSDEAATKALMPPLQVAPPKAAEPEARFDLSVVNAPAGQVFMALVSGTRYNMLLPQNLSGSITVHLKDVTLKEALETLRDLYGYDYKVQGNRIMVLSNTLQTRIFQINYLAGERRGASDLRVSSSSMTTSQNTGATATAGTTTTGTQTSTAVDSARVSMTSDVDFWRDLTTALKAIVGSEDGSQVIVNPLSGVVLVKAMPREMHSVEKYLKATQLVVEREVMLEAKIINVSLSKEYQSGINWAHFNSHGGHNWSRNANTDQFSVPSATASIPSGTPLATIDSSGNIYPSTLTGTAGVLSTISNVSSSSGVLGLAFQTGSFAALINFLETQGNVTVLSSPRIATLNNQKAVLKVGSDALYITNISTTTTSSSTSTVSTPTLTLQPYFSGISLDVTPQIDDQGSIILHVHPAVTDVKENTKTIDLGSSLGVFKLPLASSNINETDSIVRVQDGNIVAIGGLMRDEQNSGGSGLPGVRDVPVAGAFFGDRSNYRSKSELVILIKPTVIKSDSDWRDDLDKVQTRLKNYDPRLVEPTSNGQR
jgi:MSHA biogenesis protein MshL